MEFYGTLGDACWERETLEALFRAGMTGARLNLSHTTLEACAPLLEERFWPAARQAGVEAKLIVDLQGPAGLPGRGGGGPAGRGGDPCARRRVGGRPDGG